MGYSSIYVYDWNQLGMYKRILGYDKTFEVAGVADMTRKVLTHATGKGKISLTFGGDGAPNYQSVGAGQIKDQKGDRSFLLGADGKLKGDAATWLRRLNPFVYKIILKGAKKSSYSLLCAVAELFPCIPIHTERSIAIYYGPAAANARLARNRKTSVRVIQHGGGLADLDRQTR